MNIINIGGWFVGNSAIVDWLDGFEEVNFIRGEFNITRLEGGVMDMINSPSIEEKMIMINKNKRDIFINVLMLFKHHVGRHTKHLLKKKIALSYDQHLSFWRIYFKYLNKYENHLKKDGFFDEIDFWRGWLAEVANNSSGGKIYKHRVYQNPFFYDETFDGHKEVWPKLFSPCKFIFVHRDPIDQFSDIVNAKGHLLVSWPRFHGGTEAMHPADRFLEISKRIYTARLRMAEKYTKDQLVIFSFEDFLQEHGRVTEQLKVFLDIKFERDPSNRNFILDKSLRNIGKGKYNQEVRSLLQGKSYVMDEINHLREKLISHNNSI